jgi:hypothetical protein
MLASKHFWREYLFHFTTNLVIPSNYLASNISKLRNEFGVLSLSPNIYRFNFFTLTLIIHLIKKNQI